MKIKLLALLGFILTSSLMHSQTQPTKPDYIGELQLVTVILKPEDQKER
jgi:hypothetical protein